MATPTADIRLQVASNSAAAAMDLMTNKMKRMMKQMETGAEKAGNRAKKADRTFGSWAGSIAKSSANLLVMGSALSSVYGVTQLISQEMQNQIDISQKLRDRQVPYQDKLKQVLFEAVPATVQDRGAFIRDIDKRLSDAGIQDKTAGLQVIETVMSAMGDASVDKKIDFAMDIITGRRDRMNAASVDEMRAMTSAASMAQLLYEDKGSSAMAQMGLMNRAKVFSAADETSSFVNNIAPVGNKLRQFGATQVEALAFAASLSNALNDRTGQLVDTAGQNIAAKMKLVETRFGAEEMKGLSFTQRRDFIRGDSKKAKQIRDYVLGAFSSELDVDPDELAMMSESEFSKRFGAKLGGRAKTMYVAMQWFQKKGMADFQGSLNQLYDSGLDQIGAKYKAPGVIDERATYVAAEAAFRKDMEIATKSQSFRAATNEMFNKQATESLAQSRGNELFAELVTPGSQIDQILQMSGISGMDRMLNRTMRSTGAFFGGAPSYEQSLLAAESDLELARNELIRKNTGLSGQLFLDASEERAMTILEERLTTIAEEIRLLRAENKEPKKVVPADPEPRKPNAASMGGQE